MLFFCSFSDSRSEPFHGCLKFFKRCQCYQRRPLEIFTDNDGEVVFKKYSPVGELSPFAVQYADVLSRACGMTVLVCDRDRVVAAAGNSRKDLMDKRQTHVAQPGGQNRLKPVEAVER